MKKRSERLLSLLLAISLVLGMIVLPAPIKAETTAHKTIATIDTYSASNSGWTANYGSNSYGEIDLTGSDSFVIDFDLLFKGAGRIDFYLTPVDKSSTRIFYVKTIDFPGTVMQKMAANEYVRVSFVVNQKDNTYSLWFDGVSFLEGSFPASMISDTGRLQFKYIKFENVFDAPDGGVNVYASYKNGKIYDGAQPEYVNTDAPDYIADLFGSPLTTLAIGGDDRYIWDYSQNNKLYDYTQFVWETEIAGFDGANAQLVVYENKDNGSRSLTAATVRSDENAKFAGGEYVKVAIALDTTAKTYSVWVDGTKTVDAASITLSDFEAGYLRINCLTAGSMKIQSMRVYEGTEPVAEPSEPDNTEPPTEAPGAEVYYENDFESGSTSGIVSLFAASNAYGVEADASENHYLKGTNSVGGNAKFLINYNGATLSDKVVFEFDVASTNLGSTQFKFVGTGSNLEIKTSSSQAITNQSGGTTYGTMPNDGTFITLAVALNTTAATYSFWIDGNQVVEDAAMALTEVKYLQVEMSSANGQNIMLDNVMIYDGEEPGYTPPAGEDPSEPSEPTDPSNPSEPIEPSNPSEPGEPDEIPEITDTYLDEKFEGSSISVALLKAGLTNSAGTNVNEVRGDSTNHYVFMQSYLGGADYTKIYKSLSSEIDTNELVISVDVATTSLASLNINFGSFRFVGYNGEGTLYSGSGLIDDTTKKMPGDGTWVTFTIALDIETKTYDVWMGDVQIVKDAAHTLTTAKASFQIDHSGIGGNAMIDNLVIGSYADQGGSNPGGSTEPLEPVDIPDFNETYLDQNFENGTTGIVLLPGTLGAGDVNERRGDSSNHYIYMERATADMKLYASVSSKVNSSYILISFDVASTDRATTHFKIAGVDGSQYAASFNKDGVITAGGTGIAGSKTVPNDGTFVNFIIAVDTKTGKYNLWVDGETVAVGKTTSIGTFSYFQVEHTESGGNVMFDNLKIGSYGDGSLEDDFEMEGVQGEITAPGDLGNTVYHELDFEKYSHINSVIVLKQNGSGSWTEGANGNHYMHLTNDAKLLLNYNGKDLSDYVVTSMDIASTALATAHIKVYGTGGTEVHVSTNAFGHILYGGKRVGTLKKDGTFVNIAVAANTKTLKFHVWIDGTLVVYNANLPANFGNVRYIQVEPTGADGSNFMVDNMKLYDGVKPVADLPEQPKPNPGNNRYYENDFNTNASGLNLMGGAKLEVGANGNGYIKLLPITKFLWNYSRDYDLTGCVIFQMDVYASNPESLYIKGYGSKASANLVIFRVDGTMTPSYKPAEEKMKAGAFVNVAVMVNTMDNTYTIWYDGVEVVSNSLLPSDFGTLQYLMVDMTGGSSTAYALVDNLKIFNGLDTSAFAGTTVPVIDNTRDYSWMNGYLGTESDLLDYGHEVLSILNTQYRNAIIVHAGSNYVYQNGRRVQKTADEVAALVSANSKKVVYKDENGLIIINNGAVSLTAAQITSLHSFMLYTRPKANELKQLFASVTTNAHPRIIINQEKMDQIVADYKTNAQVKEWADKLLISAEATLKNPHAKYVREDGTRMGSCRTVLERSMNLSMAYILTKDSKYKDYLWEELENAAGFMDWNSKRHFLDTGEFAAGFAIAYDWLYNEWTPEQRSVLENAIRDNGLYFYHRMAYDLESGAGTYINSETNRNAVTNGGLGIAALAVFDVYPDECADILEKTYHLLERMMNEFGPDGANLEGPAYWDYQMRFLSKLMASTELTFGTDFNIYKAPGFSTTGEFYLNVDGLEGANNFHDATESYHLYSGYLFWLSNALDKPDLTKALLFKMKQFNLPGDVYSIIFYDTDIKMDANISMPLDAYYRNMELVTMRSSWANRAGIYASIHMCNTGMSHAHLDSGSFVLDIGGQRFAGDLGKEEYTLSALGTNRFHYYRLSPEGHNMFVINPDKTGEDLGVNTNGKGTVSEFVTKDRGSYTILPLSSYYAGYAQSATRGMMLGDDRRSVLIRDEIRGMTQNQNEVWWFMQMEGVEVKISEDKKSAILSKGGVDVNLQVLSDNATDWEIRLLDAKTMYPKQNLPDAEKQSVNTGWSRLAIVFKAGKDLNINVKFAELGDEKGDTPIQNIALADWEIPDGVLPEDPKLYGITIGGQELPGFDSNVTFYEYALPYGSTECPEVEVLGGEGCDIDISIPKKFPGYIRITLKNQKDPSLKSTYRIMVSINGIVTIEASNYQQGNPPKNCLDGNMATRWSVDGEAWGIFRFAEPQLVKSVSAAVWTMTQYHRLFDILVSEDGVNFTKVLEVKTDILPAGSDDLLIKYDIPDGVYRAIKFECHGGQNADGSYYSWNSFLEVQFDMVSVANPDDPNAPVDPNPGDTDNNGGSDNDGGSNGQGGGSIGEWIEQITSTEGGTAWLIVGIVGVVAVLGGAGVAVFFIIKKKKAVEVPTDEAT